jgi:hypothetical protein
VIQINTTDGGLPMLEGRSLQGDRAMSALVILVPIFVYAGAIAFLLVYVLVLRRLQRSAEAVGPGGPAAHVRAGSD